MDGNRDGHLDAAVPNPVQAMEVEGRGTRNTHFSAIDRSSLLFGLYWLCIAAEVRACSHVLSARPCYHGRSSAGEFYVLFGDIGCISL